MTDAKLKLNYQIARAQLMFRKFQAERLRKEGWDVVLEPELMVEVEEGFGIRNEGNWNHAHLGVDEFARENEVKRKVLFIGLDTGAKSRNKYLNNRGQFLEEYASSHVPNEVWLEDDHGHFSHTISSQMGYHPDFPLGLAWSRFDKEQWAWYTGKKVLNKRGAGSFTWIIGGYKTIFDILKDFPRDEWAIVTNASFGAQGVSEYGPMEEVLKELEEAGVFHCASAGNSGADPEGGTRVGYPGNSIYTMAWAAIDKNGKAAGFSSRGPEVDYSAGGVSVLGCGKGEDDLFLANGTSMASPNGGAAVGRILAAHPEITTQAELREFLNEKITDLGEEGKDIVYGHGLPFLPKYEGEDTPPPPPPPSPEPVEYVWEFNGVINVIMRDHLAPGGHVAHRPTGYTIEVEVGIEPAEIDHGQSESVARYDMRNMVNRVLNRYNTAWLSAEGDDVMEGVGRTIGAHVVKLDGFVNVNFQNLALALKKAIADEVEKSKEGKDVEYLRMTVADDRVGDIIC